MTAPATNQGMPLRTCLAAAALAALSGCAGMEYGSNAYDPARMPGTAEVAERTQYRDYNYLRPMSGYQQAVADRIAELAQAPMTEAAAVEIALLQDTSVQDLMLEHWAQRPSFVRDVAARVGSAGSMSSRSAIRPRSGRTPSSWPRTRT